MESATTPSVAPETRRVHERWLEELTTIPTATGHEDRVIEFIERWAREREGVSISTDDYGNLTLSLDNADTSRPPVYFTAHLDHPAFVVERVISPTTLELAFRGGVMADYFEDARINIHLPDHSSAGATLTGLTDPSTPSPFKHYTAELDDSNVSVTPGDFATWELPAFEITDDGIVHTNACDDLAAAAAALAALDLLRAGSNPPDARILFTLAEEVGFIGAIAACKAGTIPDGARVLALENSRAFPESPIGGGPIVRVGDRISVFSPRLTSAVSKVAEGIAGGPAQPQASQKAADMPAWKWQRKLMAGGACEATVYCAFGHEATCLCLPLGNYHNMADLDAVQAGTNTEHPRVAREYIAVSDYHALVDLLAACATGLDDAAPITKRLEDLWTERKFVLNDDG